MDIRELLISLSRQEENLSNLLKVAGKKQRAIVDGILERIDESISEEEKLLQSIGIQEKHRIELIGSFSEKLGLRVKHKKLNEFLEELKPRLEDMVYYDLMAKRNNIIKLVTQVNNINHQNKILIVQSIGFVKKTITSLIDTKKNSLVDRRI